MSNPVVYESAFEISQRKFTMVCHYCGIPVPSFERFYWSEREKSGEIRYYHDGCQPEQVKHMVVPEGRPW